MAPSILVAEVAAALSRGTQDAALAHRVIARLMGSRLIQLKPVTPALAELAGNIAADHRVRGCDAIYLALAMQMNDVLVTLDRQQLERGSAVAMTMQPKT